MPLSADNDDLPTLSCITTYIIQTRGSLWTRYEHFKTSDLWHKDTPCCSCEWGSTATFLHSTLHKHTLLCCLLSSLSLSLPVSLLTTALLKWSLVNSCLLIPLFFSSLLSSSLKIDWSDSQLCIHKTKLTHTYLFWTNINNKDIHRLLKCFQKVHSKLFNRLASLWPNLLQVVLIR